jgi:2-polyprenyl-3-methyl-5-hydroxy-6-metoxy-1,4-benzoquinol methylase
MAKSVTAQRYSKIAAECYRDAPAGMRWMQRFRPYICPFEELAPLVPSGARVLDVGCGAGLFLILLAAEGKRVDAIGFDSSKPAIRAANVAAQSPLLQGSSLRFELRDAEAEWPAGEFDVVSLIDVAHHIPPKQRDQVLSALAAKLAPGGVLLYKDISTRPRWMAAANRLHDLMLARQWISYWPLAEVRRKAADIGLQCESEWKSFRWWYPHETLVLRKPVLRKPLDP